MPRNVPKNKAASCMPDMQNSLQRNSAADRRKSGAFPVRHRGRRAKVPSSRIVHAKVKARIAAARIGAVSARSVNGSPPPRLIGVSIRRTLPSRRPIIPPHHSARSWT